MKKIFYIILGVLPLIVFTSWVWSWFFGEDHVVIVETPTVLPVVTDPSQSAPVNTGATVATRTGGEQTVRDFLADPEVVEDVVNPGQYLLVGRFGYCLADGSCPQAGDEDRFQVVYSALDDYFFITLFQEPLGETRDAAQQFLQQKLNLTADETCSLRYTVFVPREVNEHVTGEDIGFSNCPGAVQF